MQQRIIHQQIPRQNNKQFIERQNSNISFVEKTTDRNKRNVINQYDNQTNLTNKKDGDKLKEQGNKFFEQKKYIKAIDAYTAAIVDNESLYYSNRAISYQAIGQMDKSMQDCVQALDYDGENVRALFLYGTLLVGKCRDSPQSNLNEQIINNMIIGIRNLEKGNNILANKQDASKIKLKTQIQSNLSKSKRILFLMARYLDEQNIKNMMDVIKQILERSSKKYLLDQQQIQRYTEKNLMKDQIFPDYFQCVITQDIMKEPVIIQSGHTYEKDALLQQFRCNGLKDPCTRENVDPSKVYYNENIKQGIQELKSKYGWLDNEYSNEQQYKNIKLE